MSSLDLLEHVIYSGGHLLSSSPLLQHSTPPPHKGDQPVSRVKWNENRTLNLNEEGVEDEDTLQALRHLQCEQAQGYHISRPVSADEFNRWYQDRLQKNPANPNFTL